MGRRSSQRRNAAMLDSDDTDSVSSSSTTRSDMMLSSLEEVQFGKETVLDQCVDALYEKRFATLLQLCLSSIKRGSSKEIALASHVIGLLALTAGPGDKAHDILKESQTLISEAALKSRSDNSKISSLLECLAIITFVGGEEPEETEKSMRCMWLVINPKLGPNVATAKPSPAMITVVVSSWSFLLTTMDGWTLDPKSWQGSISYFSTLLDKEDRSVRIAAGETLALVFEIGSLEKFSGESKGSSDSSTDEANKSRELLHIQGLKAKVLNQVRTLSAEAGGKGSAKKDLNNQRNTFRDILEFLEDGYSPEASAKIGGLSFSTSTWAHLIQLNFLKHFLGGGFVKHMQENEFLHDVFGFTPNKKLPVAQHHVSGTDKRMYKSPNSVLNKARTQFLNKQRMLSQDKNVGYYTGGDEF
ncbi:uncharacterized protein LOC129902189 isoform X2 [Solanum dulcamara]|uniref:uncharacterized protein LOC129902189 isoform X2 n=1 Tax=Solanum dulcamara TaxID=45834 RepID=UPI00248672A8|nr:uncharacterized protein LOC129902189 isoform X2 [Solanum dulcamara]